MRSGRGACGLVWMTGLMLAGCQARSPGMPPGGGGGGTPAAPPESNAWASTLQPMGPSTGEGALVPGAGSGVATGGLAAPVSMFDNNVGAGGNNSGQNTGGTDPTPGDNGAGTGTTAWDNNAGSAGNNAGANTGNTDATFGQNGAETLVDPADNNRGAGGSRGVGNTSLGG